MHFFLRFHEKRFKAKLSNLFTYNNNLSFLKKKKPLLSTKFTLIIKKKFIFIYFFSFFLKRVDRRTLNNNEIRIRDMRKFENFYNIKFCFIKNLLKIKNV